MTDLHKLTIAAASPEIAGGRVSSRSLVESLVRRIDDLEPSLKAWVTVDRDGAVEAADTLDQELAKKGPRGPLHGIPLGIKDIYFTAGMKTTACSKIHADFVPSFDAASVTRLRRPGP